MTYPLVLDLAADGIPVPVTCRVLGFSKQAFYAWRKDPVPQRDWDEAHLINAAIDIHADDPEFGHRFIADELPARGITAAENKVARLCSQQRIWSAFAKRRGLTRKVGPPVHDDLVARQFTAEGPDQTWLTDITEHPTGEGKLYLRDQGRVLQPDRGYSMDAWMTAALAVSALRNAVALRCPAGTVVVHSDRGSQFRSAGRFKIETLPSRYLRQSQILMAVHSASPRWLPVRSRSYGHTGPALSYPDIGHADDGLSRRRPAPMPAS